MPDPKVTLVVVPRDRFSSVEACTQSIIDNSKDVSYRIAFLDFGYAESTKRGLRKICSGTEMEIVDCGRQIPMDGFRDYLPKITTPYTCWVDNDTFVTEGCLARLVRSAEEEGMRAILPLTFEREGLDVDKRHLEKRVHISHAELRKVTVDGTEYVFDYKPYRRVAKEDVPPGPWTIDFFELHTFFAETALLRQIDFPSMVVREHVDIGIQLNKLGVPIWCEPRAEVVFDNLHLRPTWQDLKFFFYRWSDPLIDKSHELFEQRHGWKFFNEQFMKNWAFRRRVFSVARFCFVPHKPADLLSRVMVRLFRPPMPAHLSHDPTADSERALEPVSTQQTTP